MKKYDADFVYVLNTALADVVKERYNPEVGICYNVWHVVRYKPIFLADVFDQNVSDAWNMRDAVDDWMHDTWKKWPSFSGNVNYPIVVGSNDNEQAFWQFEETDDKWNNNTEYGRLRWDLLSFLLEEASKLQVK